MRECLMRGLPVTVGETLNLTDMVLYLKKEYIYAVSLFIFIADIAICLFWKSSIDSSRVQKIEKKSLSRAIFLYIYTSSNPLCIA